jgi:Tfp pilus assembly protein PilF/transcriptional regulator with XRE-family HTH domain
MEGMAGEAPADGRFGPVLRDYRTAANLTQEELAARCGLSVHAIGMLERGVRRAPRPRTVELLARGLGLDGTQRRALVAAARRSSPRNVVAPEPTEHFVGREAELAGVRDRLRLAGRLTIHGLGGVGKTQLAARYLHDHRDDYPDGLFWLRADQESTLGGDLAGLAWRLDLPERTEAEQEVQIEAVLDWLREHPHWLLVLDNLESGVVDGARRWLPPDLPGHLLITSRTPGPPPRLSLEPLPHQVASRYLLDRTGQADARSAGAVAETLGCLPLALAQAAGYLDQTGRDMCSYAELLRTHFVELMAEGHPDDYPRSVVGTLNLSFERLAQERPAAVALLRLCAFLAADDIPISVLQAGADELPPPLGAALRDDIETDRAVAALRRYSLVERHGDGLRAHRIVQAVIRQSMAPEEYNTWLAAAIRILRPHLPENLEERPELWPMCARLSPHAQVVEALAGTGTVEPVALAAILNGVGVYLWSRGEYELGASVLHQALARSERVLGPEHRQTMEAVQNLGLLRWYQGDLAGGRTLIERCAVLLQARPDPEDERLATTLHNLATIVQAQGDLDTARPLYERALALRNRVLGPDHPHTAYTLNNLGTLLRNQGDRAGARPLLERALFIREHTLGPEHPHTAHSLHHLGWLLRDQGDLAAARPCLERATAIREKVLGPDHPATARSQYHLAVLLWRTGEQAAARRLTRRAMVALARRLGTDHHWTVEARRTLDEM